jgi:hypothetical protein
MNVKEYVGDLNGGSLLQADARKIANLLLQSRSKEQAKIEIVENNILQRKSIHSALRVANTLNHRLKALGPSFWQDLLDSDGQEYAQLLMLSLIIHSPVVADFMKLVLGEYRRQYKPALDPQAWEIFIDDQCRRISGLAEYSEGTLDKMRKNVFRALAEAGYINSVRSKQLQPVFVLPRTKYQIERLGRLDLEPVMECTI